MNAAKLETSARLQRTLRVLRAVSPDWASTRDIIGWAHVCAVNSCMAELRANGISIETRRIHLDGRAVYQYRLTSVPRLKETT